MDRKPKTYLKKEGEEKKRVAIYIRVSSNEQKLEGLSIDAQRKYLEDYALSRDMWVYKIYTDAGVSAKIPIKNRPEGRKMFEDMKESKFSAIIVVKLDRAFRNTVDAILTSDELRKENIDLISLKEQFDTTTPTGRLFFKIMSSLAEWEREITSDRVNDIHEYNFSRGVVVGKAPIGYVFDKKKKSLVPDSKKSKVVQEIFMMASEGKTYKEICEKFKINPQTYYNILRNRIYIGFINYKGQEAKGIHKPLISEELFYKVNHKS